MEKDLKYSALLGVYRGLLTEKQAQTMEYYYDDDMSLAEIADEAGISRQGVRDFIKRGEAVLDEAEKNIGLLGRLRRLDEILDAANEIKAHSVDKRLTALAEKIIAAATFIDGE